MNVMHKPPYNVLFLCTGNSARSVMAEALLNVLGANRFKAYSAGSFPSGVVQPTAAELARSIGYDEPLRSKSWHEFARADAPPMDFIVTVCDNAAGEVCPVWPARPVSAHWGVPDPAAVMGSEEERKLAFLSAWLKLRRRIDLLLALPIEKLDDSALQRDLRAIADKAATDEH